ncbi:MAG: hypothetical protein M1830_010732 [Pleopsidium flavum]|nr:MAG: hypothetical protein M1830_010732 [Pleopsidium flavum]
MSELLHFILDYEKQFRRFDDRARLPSLYSDFRVQQTTNPDGYAANVAAWQIALANAARAGLIPSRGGSSDLLILRTSQELLQALETKEWGQPLALSAVVNEAIAQKHMIPLREFLGARTSIYHRGWAVTPWQVISWGLRQIGLAKGAYKEDGLFAGQFVLLGNVEETAKRVLQRVSGRTNRADRVFSRDMFTLEFGGTLNEKYDLTESDVGVLLTYLVRDKQEVAYDGQTIKFRTSTDGVSVITTEDTTIASLKSLIADLNTQVTALTSRIDDLTLAARNAVSSKNRLSALAALRSKKLAESTLLRRSETLAQLEGVYSKIEQAADQVEIVRVMEASAGALKRLNSDVGGVEKVEEVVEELRDEMSKVDEVGNAIIGTGQGETTIDEAEVDDELEAMEREQRLEKEKLEVTETKLRLSELGGADDIIHADDIAMSGEAKQSSTQAEAEESTANLGRMSLEESRPWQATNNRVQDTATQEVTAPPRTAGLTTSHA